jgi:hypothetical protein
MVLIGLISSRFEGFRGSGLVVALLAPLIFRRIDPWCYVVAIEHRWNTAEYPSHKILYKKG